MLGEGGHGIWDSHLTSGLEQTSEVYESLECCIEGKKTAGKNHCQLFFFVESTAVGIWLMFQSMKVGLNLSGECAKFIGFFNPE